MIAKLFRRLTAAPGAECALFDWATAVAREPACYVEGGVPDSIDGRFAMVATIVALCCVRLEQLGAEGDALSIALTERFAAVMESEHRELGFGDPTLGKIVLKLVGSLAHRVSILRPAMNGESDWRAATEGALTGVGGSEDAKAWRAARLETLGRRLQSADLEALAAGDVQ